MLTKEQIYGGITYRWHTEYALNTVDDSLYDFLMNELSTDVEVLDILYDSCIVLCDENKYLIRVYDDGDFCSHISKIELLQPK